MSLPVKIEAFQPNNSLVIDQQALFFKHIQEHVDKVAVLKQDFMPSLSLIETPPPLSKDEEYHIQQALGELLGLLQVVADIPDKQKIYTYLFQLFPFIDDKTMGSLLNEHVSQQSLKKSGPIQELLNASPLLSQEQQTLALLLAFWHIRQSRSLLLKDRLIVYQKAMNYLAIAITIEDCHSFASQLILRVVKECLVEEDRFKKRLWGARYDFKKFEKNFALTEELKKFYYHDNDNDLWTKLYTIVIHLIAKEFEPSKKEEYQEFIQRALILRDKKLDLSPPVTKKYAEKLRELRAHFKIFIAENLQDIETVRNFQTATTQKIINLVQELLADVFIILGPPPCTYDLRATGSVAREEACPFSDLELMLLVKEEGHEEYFNTLLQIFNLLTISLGETPLIQLVFTSLHKKNPSGFHVDFDANPVRDSSLMGIPEVLALLQHENAEPGTPNQMVRTSLSLDTNDTSLFEVYQTHMGAILNVPPEKPRRQDLAFQLFKKRLADYNEVWGVLSFSFHLKKQYVELLNHLLSDMRLYWGIEKTNSLDIIDELVTKGIFSLKSGDLLKKAVSEIYCIRLRLQQAYGEQKEEGYSSQTTALHPELLRGTLSNEEQKQLEQIYWLVIRPLYQRLETVDQGKNFEEVFHQLDLVQTAFDEILSHPSPLKPCLTHLVSYLLETDTSKEIHTTYYKKMVENESLRLTYFQTIHEHGSEELKEHLAKIPNRAGWRFSFPLRWQKFIATLEKVTLTERPRAKGTSVKIEGPFLTPRYLTPEIIESILDSNGDIKLCPGSAHRVAPAQGLHFKQKPTHPLMEYAIHNLYFRLYGPLTPPNELVRFEVTINGKTKVYPVLISETILGPTLKEKENSKQEIKFSKASWARWSWMLLCSILTKPGDGRMANFILDLLNGIFCVDNDISFVEPVIDNLLSQKIYFCSALFGLFPDQPLDPEVLEEFCTLDPDAILRGWIHDVIDKEKEYLALFTDEEQKKLYEEDPDNRFKATILFRQGTLATLNLQFCRLQNFIFSQLQKKAPLTPLELLKQMISLKDKPTIENTAGVYVLKAYRRAQNYKVSIDEKLKNITDRDQTKSLNSFQSDQACVGHAPTLEEIKKQQLYTPANAREELFFTLLERSCDDISIGTVRGKRTLRTSFKYFKTERGPDLIRQVFVLEAVSYLAQKETEKPLSVTLQHCSVLNSTTLEPFLHDKLEYLDLRFCSQIQDKDIEMIQRKCPHLKELNLSGCSQIKQFALSGIFSSSPLEFLDLEYLSIEQCPNLVALQLRAPMLKELKANKNPNLSLVKIPFEWELIPMEFDECPKVNFSYLTLQGHSGAVYALISLRGGVLASGSMDGNIKLWDTTTGIRLHALEGHLHPVTALAALEEGILASGSLDKTIKLWDTATGKCLSTLEGHSGEVCGLTALAGGVLASGSSDKTIKLWDTATGECLRNLVGHSSSVRAITAFPGGVLASGSDDKTIKLWDTTTGECLRTLKGHSSAVYALAALAGGVLASGSDDNTIQLWDIATGKCLRTLKGHSDQVWALTTLSEGVLASGSWDNTIKLWDIATGKCLRTLKGHSHQVRALTTLSGGVLASGCYDTTIKLWKFNRVPKMRCIATLSDPSGPVHAFTPLAEGLLACGSQYNTIKLWDTVTGKCLRTLEGHSNRVNTLTSLIGGILASGSDDNTIKLWDTVTGKCLRTLKGHVSSVYALTALPEGVLASGSVDNTIKFWDMATGKCLRTTLKGHSGVVYALTALIGGGVLAGGFGDNSIKLWNTATGECLRTLNGHSSSVRALTALPGGVLASGSLDDTIKLWNTATGECLCTLNGHSSSVYALTALPGGVLASGYYDHTIKLWDTATGECLRTLEEHSSPVHALTTFEGRILVSGSHDNTIKLWK